MVRWLAQALVVISACLSTGLVALFLAGPLPARASIWPPVGIALAALVIGGRRLWPAVAMAAVLLALVQLRQSANAPWLTQLIGATAVGLLYAVQALVGRWLLDRTTGPDPSRLGVRDILMGVIVAGPLHTLLASTGGAAVLNSLGLMAWSSWPGWWASDTLGGLIFTPLTLVIVYRTSLAIHVNHPHHEPQAGPAEPDRAREMAEKTQFEKNLLETQRLEALGVLAGGLAHDFNNLLTDILGNTSHVRELLPAGSSLHEYLRPVEKSAEHAAQLCQQVLGYASRGGQPRGVVDLNRLIEEAADLVRLSVARRATLKSELATGLPLIEADPGQLRQVLLNLVQNASEALGSSGGTVTMRTGGGKSRLDASQPPTGSHWIGTLPAGTHVWIEVTDTGAGMDEATLSRLFTPFFSTKFTGRGLGLAAIRGIVEAHHGAIRFASTPGIGTEFRIYLPALTIPSVGVDEPTPWPLRTVAPTRSALVVDDEPAVRKLAALSLRSLGFAVSEAAAGPEALELFRANPERFALVLLDLSLEVSDGRDVLVEVRKARPDLPVILTSGYPEPVGLPYGPTLQFLQKPFRPVDLKGCVRRVIGSTPEPSPR